MALSPSRTALELQEPNDDLNAILNNFPPTIFAVAYGSAVFAQKNQQRGKMIDLIFVVDDPSEWHEQNLKLNPEHYSFLKYLGSKTIASIQENLACGVYYNTFANVDNKVLKYGVISTEAVIDDLKNWTHAYIPGRLHKPVRELVPSRDPELIKCIRLNHESALRSSLLQLPPTATKFDLYYAITELSYIGDSRMIIGEHPNKVQNIVTSNLPSFDAIYLPLISRIPTARIKQDRVTQDKSSKSIRAHLIQLPSHLKYHIAHKYKGGGYFFSSYNDLDFVMTELSTDDHADIPRIVRDAVGQLIWISSLRQTLTGFLSTGVLGSLKYALSKLKKALFSE